MKRILRFAALLILLTNFSQGQVSLSNFTLQNYGADEFTPLESHIDITNNTSNSVDVNVIRTIDQIVTGHEELFCFGLFCYGVGTDTSDFPTTITGNTTDNTFKVEVKPLGYAGITQLHYRFYDINNISDSVGITLVFDFASTGIDEVKNEPYLKFATQVNSFGMFAYNLPSSASKAHLDFHNLLGAKLNSVSLNTKQGIKKVDTNSMNNGIYIVSLVVDNKIIQSHRMVVNHSR